MKIKIKGTTHACLLGVGWTKNYIKAKSRYGYQRSIDVILFFVIIRFMWKS